MADPGKNNERIDDVQPQLPASEVTVPENPSLPTLREDPAPPTRSENPSPPSPRKSPSMYTIEEDMLREYMKTESQEYRLYPGTEQSEYNYTNERHNMQTTKFMETTAYLLKGCLGAGILNMHVAYMFGGIWTSLIATAVIGPIVTYCMWMLVRSAQTMYVRIRVPTITYGRLAEVAVATGPWKSFRRCSKKFGYLVDGTLFMGLCGTSCIFEIMIAVTIKQAVESLSPPAKDANLHVRWYILMITVPLLLLCMIRNLRNLAPFSLLADAIIAICVCTTLVFSMVEAGSIKDRATWKSFPGLIKFIGICLFSVNGLGVSLSVESHMSRPKNFHIVLKCGMSIVVVCVTITGFVGYWGWGESSRGPITVHLPPYTVLIIMQFVMAIMLSLIFAIRFWVPFRIAWHYVGKENRKCIARERLFRAFHVSMITAVAMVFHDMTTLMIFLGHFYMGFLAFVVPAFIEILVTWREQNILCRLIKDVILIVVGLALTGAAFYITFACV